VERDDIVPAREGSCIEAASAQRNFDSNQIDIVNHKESLQQETLAAA
jgi:hypothetical protein